MKKFADFSRGLFYLSLTGLVGLVAYSLVNTWQPLWENGFKDFKSISIAIKNLEESTKPAIVLVPEMVTNMNQMNKTMAKMEVTMSYMGNDVSQMRTAMNYQMSNVNYQMSRINKKFTPMGMMPFNW